MDRFLALFCRNPGLHLLFEQAGAANEDGTDTPREENLMGSVFTSLCHFWSLVHDGLWIYYADRPNAPPTHWRHKLAEHKYREIIAWGLTISHCRRMMRSKEPARSCHSVRAIFIWMHVALLDITRPFRSDSPGPRPGMDDLYGARQFAQRRLLGQHVCLLYLSNAVLESPRDPDWHLYFLLCIYGNESLRRPYSVSASIGRILQQLEHQDVSLERAQVEALAKDFEELAVFNEPINHGNIS
uniref:Transcription factor domain-containing protein n=1 Tax=Bionectria ochroleuca TaxID=29856 RepID=A0A8H7K5C3_BIOOC